MSSSLLVDMKVQLGHLDDVLATYMLLCDYADLYFPELDYRVIDTPTVELDPVHMEVDLSDRTWEPVVKCRLFVVPAEEQYQLSRYGLDNVRDLVIQAAVPSLIEAGLASYDPDTRVVTPRLGPGDLVSYSGIDYEVLERHRGQMFGNTDCVLYFLLNCQKLRRESSEYAGI